jgi:hypothetical protein
MRRAHAVRQARIDLQRGLGQQLGRQRRGVGDRHDLVVVAVQHERGHVDLLQVLGEVGLRERLDAVVVRLDGARHALHPPVLADAFGDLRAGAVVAVERQRDVAVELGAIAGDAGAQAVEHVDRQPARVGRRPEHERRHGTDQHGRRGALRAVAAEVVRHLAAAGRVADVDRVAQVERLGQRGEVAGVVIHVVAAEDLARAPVAAPVVRDDAVALLREEQHLAVPVVRGQGPAVREDDGLARAPVLVEDLRAVLGRDRAHVLLPLGWMNGTGLLPMPWQAAREAPSPSREAGDRRAPDAAEWRRRGTGWARNLAWT